MSTVKNQKKTKKSKNNGTLGYFAIYYMQSITSTDFFDEFCSGTDHEKRKIRTLLERKSVIERTQWKRNHYWDLHELKVCDSPDARAFHQETFLKSRLMTKLRSIGVTDKKIQKNIYALHGILKYKMKGCSAEKKELAIFLYFYHMKMSKCIIDPIHTICLSWASENDDLKKLRRTVFDVIKRLSIVFTIQDDAIYKITKKYAKQNKTTYSSIPFHSIEDIKKNNRFLKNFIHKKEKLHDPERKKAYFRHKIWKEIHKYDADEKEKRFTENLLCHKGRKILKNVCDFFDFGKMYQKTLSAIEKNNLSYESIKKSIQNFVFVASKYRLWFLSNKKEDREKHLLNYRLTGNLRIFNVR